MPIWKDEIVEEIHRYREEYAAKFNYDLDAIFEDMRRKQAQSGRKHISFVSDNEQQIEKSPGEDRKAA